MRSEEQYDFLAENAVRSFSNGKPVDSIETERSRIILHELEKDWWLLAVCTDVIGRRFLTDSYCVVCRSDSPSELL